MKPICSICNTEITSDNINVVTDLAKCQNCGNVSKLSEMSITSKKKVEFTPPGDSRISMEKGLHGEVTFTNPKKGITKSTIPILIFATIWLLFIGLWTFLATLSDSWFALFSIPFWLVGIGMFFGTIFLATQSETIRLTRTSLILEKKRIFNSTYLETSIRSIQSIELNNSIANSKNVWKNFTALKQSENPTNRILGYPTLNADGQQTHFFVNTSTPEKEWIVNLLNHLVENLK